MPYTLSHDEADKWGSSFSTREDAEKMYSTDEKGPMLKEDHLSYQTQVDRLAGVWENNRAKTYSKDLYNLYKNDADKRHKIEQDKLDMFTEHIKDGWKYRIPHPHLSKQRGLRKYGKCSGGGEVPNPDGSYEAFDHNPYFKNTLMHDGGVGYKYKYKVKSKYDNKYKGKSKYKRKQKSKSKHQKKKKSKSKHKKTMSIKEYKEDEEKSCNSCCGDKPSFVEKCRCVVQGIAPRIIRCCESLSDSVLSNGEYSWTSGAAYYRPITFYQKVSNLIVWVIVLKLLNSLFTRVFSSSKSSE